VKPSAAFIGSPPQIERVYALGRQDEVAKRTTLKPDVITGDIVASGGGNLTDIQVLFSTWGFPALEAAQWANLPNLQAVFYAAGSVRNFAKPLLERGVKVISAWHANAVPVAEYTVAQILLANKGFFLNVEDCATHAGRTSSPRANPGNFAQTVAILGAGAIGSKVIAMMKALDMAVDIIVFDPFLTDDQAGAMGVRRVTVEQAFADGDVVSNHLANNVQTVGMISPTLLASMKPGVTFINTGRGATVHEVGLAQAMQARPNAVALLDVTMPEPPQTDSPFWSMPNIKMTSHIAGALGHEVVRMADYVIAEFDRWQAGEPLKYDVTLAMLETMA